ncbi:MAG TPA: FCD domain-containing protein, partial [Jiangellaceae bacterium]
LHEVRAIVEPAAAELAAARRSEADLAELDAALARMATAVGPGSADDAVAADLAFHRTLLAASHNELLARMEVLIEAGLAQRDRLVHSAEPGHDPVPAHRNVLEAIRRQDAAAARRAVDALLVTSAADLARLHPATRLPEASEPSGIPVDAP